MHKMVIAIALTIFTFSSFAKDYFGNVAYLSNHDPFIQLLNEMQRAYDQGKFNYKILPFERSLRGVIEGKADFHLPIVKPKGKKEFGFAFSTVTIGKVIFGLYVNKNNKKINLRNFTSKDFVIETDAAHVNFFDFPIGASSCPKCSLQKVNSGRIDAYLYSVLLADIIINLDKKEFQNLDTYYYKTYDIKFGIPSGDKGKDIDNLLTTLIGKTQENGTFNKIFKTVYEFNKQWKPTRK